MTIPGLDWSPLTAILDQPGGAVGDLWDSNLIPVQSLGFSCWSDVVLVHKDHLVEHTACEVPLQWLTWTKMGDIISLCQVSDSAHDRKVWILVCNSWSKGEITGTRVGHTDYMAVGGNKQPFHLGKEHLRPLEM